MPIVLYAVLLIPVFWVVADAARRPSSVLSARAKSFWIVACAVGWLAFGILGAGIAAVYLVGPRRRMNAQLH